ncbi:BrnT family toxin [Cupriavidus nantongensis]|uniref:BrnT family toxin n=1 Tax=Cupriavidus nantongensis TaxID=1796606 RepID=UPI0009EEAE1F|nr:BrnT family toxin [Cupriavidus nantongensis]
MIIEFDPAKRDRTLGERGLDFARASEVFAGTHFTGEDTRERYPEPRYITVGTLDGRMVVMVWTTRGKARRIISMRKANEREQARYLHHLGGSR